MVKKKKSNLLRGLLILTLLFVLFWSFASISDTELLGSNDLGQIVKHTYSHYENPDIKIAVVSGMHPRENLHKFILPEVCKVLSVFNNVEVVNYQVSVTSGAEDFKISRANGESLVHDYVVNDISRSGFNLVIIGHDHEDGYGEGYYIATPSMDASSVELAHNVSNDLGFNYYTRDTSKASQSTSISSVDNPIVNTGTKLFVYEIPENDFFLFAFINSYRLLHSSLSNL